MRSMSFSMGGQNMKMETQTDITDAKIVLADGTEVPAKMVLRDKDLDLAFLKPKEKPAGALPHLKLSASPAPKVLDDIITLGRLGRIVKRTPTVGIDQIRAIIRKPRTCYVAGTVNDVSTGCPVFNTRGQPLGLQIVKMKPIKGQGMGMLAGMGSGMQSFIQPVILPCEDLMEVARQALAAKDETAEAPAEKKAE
jgi:S1-C subfamily serine protease